MCEVRRMVTPIPVYSLKGRITRPPSRHIPRYFRGWFTGVEYPDKFYNISRICEIVGNHVPVPLEYKGRVEGLGEAEGNGFGWRGVITAEQTDFGWGYATVNYFKVFPIYSGEWLTQEETAQVTAHEGLHLLGVEHCHEDCLMGGDVFDWSLCDRHRRHLHEIARVLSEEGWEGLPPIM